MKVLMISRPTLFTVPGGDTVQMTETAKALGKMGIEAEIHTSGKSVDYSGFDLIHFFNIIRPNSITPHVEKSKLPFVISTIFVDYSEIERHYRGILFRSLTALLGSDGVDYLKTLARSVKNREGLVDNGYLLRGHKKSVERLLNEAALLLPNSHSEYQRLKLRYRFENAYMPIPNGVSEDFFSEPELHNEPRSGVVCIGRIEFVKNQLSLIRALKGAGISLKIIGKPAPNHKRYYNACLREADENVSFVGQVSRKEVIDILKRAKVHALPSFFETTGLSSLEAAALGCNIIITDRGDQREYFEDMAEYCSPDDPNSIRAAIEKALATTNSGALQNHIKQKYTWEKAARETAKAYRKVLFGTDTE